MSVVRILIVDDNVDWREFVSCLLLKEKRLEVVGEADNGLKAIELATRTKPNVILSDISMPGINGLETARQIRLLEPDTRMVFLTSEIDPDIVGAALNIGALAYVLKSDAGKDLLAAIHSAIAGVRFISRGFPSLDLTGSGECEDLDGRSGATAFGGGCP